MTHLFYSNLYIFLHTNSQLFPFFWLQKIQAKFVLLNNLNLRPNLYFVHLLLLNKLIIIINECFPRVRILWSSLLIPILLDILIMIFDDQKIIYRPIWVFHAKYCQIYHLVCISLVRYYLLNFKYCFNFLLAIDFLSLLPTMEL